MPWGTSVMNYASKAAGYASSGFNAGAKYLGKTGMAATSGAAAGGLYGMTAGRDPGQSRLGGFMTGALGGAALGAGGYRYGGAMYRGGRLGGSSLLGGLGRAAGVGPNANRYAGMARGAAQGLAWRVQRDAKWTRQFFGTQMTKASNAFNGLRR